MIKFLRRNLTYANVMATVAVFLVLGGGAYAATQLPKNSVGTRQIKNGSITPAKLSAAAKMAIQGPTGPPGPAGTPGASGATKSTVRTVPTYTIGRSIASCNSGETATGGGGWVHKDEPKAFIFNSTPLEGDGKPTAWEVEGEDVNGNLVLVAAYVICVSP